MRVALEKLNDNPLEVCEDIPAERWELDSSDIKFTDSIRVCVTFTKTTTDIVVKAAVTTHKDIVCARCLNHACQVVTQEFKRSYALAELKDYLEVDDDIREEILLNYPMKVLCKPDCKGLCPECGANLNSENCRCPGKQPG